MSRAGIDLNTGEEFNPWAGLSETPFQQAVYNLAHAHGWRVAHFRTTKITRKDGETYHATAVAFDGTGWPDLFLVRGTVALARELKTDRGVVSIEQRDWIGALELAAVDVGVWRPRDYRLIRETLTARDLSSIPPMLPRRQSPPRRRQSRGGR